MNSVVNLSKRVSEEASTILDNVKDAISIRRSFSQLSENKATNKWDVQETYDHPSHSAMLIRQKLDREVREEQYAIRKQRSGEVKASLPLSKSSRPSTCSTQPTPDRVPSIDETSPIISAGHWSSSSRFKKKNSIHREVSSKTDDSFTNFENCEEFWPTSARVDVNPFEVDSLVSTLNALPSDALASIIRQLVAVNPDHLNTIKDAVLGRQ